MWKASQLRGPALELTGLEYQPAWPPSGITTMSGLPAVQSRMFWGGLSKVMKSWRPPWSRYRTG